MTFWEVSTLVVSYKEQIKIFCGCGDKRRSVQRCIARLSSTNIVLRLPKFVTSSRCSPRVRKICPGFFYPLISSLLVQSCNRLPCLRRRLQRCNLRLSSTKVVLRLPELVTSSRCSPKLRQIYPGFPYPLIARLNSLRASILEAIIRHRDSRLMSKSRRT